MNVFTDENKTFQELAIRPALYDELNPTIGRPNNTSLVVFDTRLRFNNHKLSMRGLDIFRVSSLNTPRIDLPDDNSMSWKIQLGAKSINQKCENCLVAAIEGGVGLSKEIVSGLNFYALIKSGLQNNRFDQGTLWLGPEIGSYIEPASWWKILFSYELEAFQNGMKTKDDIWRLEQRFGKSQNWDFRIEFSEMDDRQLRLNFGWYL